MSAGVEGQGTQQDESGVYGEAVLGDGVHGLSHAEYKAGASGINDNAGTSAGPGVYGQSRGAGVIGESSTWMGVYGRTDSTTGGAGVMGEGVAGGPGVIGKSQHWHGVYGETQAPGATGAAAVWGENLSDGSGVVGHSAHGAGIYAKSETGSAAVLDGKVEVHGDVEVSGDIRLLGGDLAELFETRSDVEPGTVMSLHEEGRVAPSDRDYDKKVVGVVAGAGTFRPGVILDAGRADGAQPVAMVGKTFCRVDASTTPIEIGDLLTTSRLPGHAMKAADPVRAFGAVLGKAMAPLASGTGLIPIIVTLQ